MKVITIAVAAIDAADRSRPVNHNVAAQLAEDIRRRGLRQPVEVAKAGDGWRLVSGGHRLEAHRLLGREEIDAVEVKGSALELRRDELMDNLGRNELSALERAVALADLKAIFQEMNPETKHGGSRQGTDLCDENQVIKLSTWYSEVATRSERGSSTIRREAAIGAHLSPQSIERLRGTDFEDNQKALELLSKQGHDRQALIVGLLLRQPDPVPSVAEAVALLDGRVKTEDKTDRSVAVALDHWNRSVNFRRAFLARVPDDHLLPLLAERGYLVTRTEAAE